MIAALFVFNSEGSTLAVKIGLAMVGGGAGSFIGPVHRMAAELDGRIELVAGAFSSDSARSKAAGAHYSISPDRAYASFEDMFIKERARADGARIAMIAAPNDVHFPAAKAAITAGFAVVCDKPMARTAAEAAELAGLVEAHAAPFCLTYSYAGYPMLREARTMIAAGELGEIRKAVIGYPQGWLSQAIERAGDRQAQWRTDPSRAGAGGCSGDIAVHAFNLLEFVTGKRVTSLCAQMSRIVPGRLLDDDCNFLLTLGRNAPAVIHCSQIATGARNGLTLHVWGERGGLGWSHERPDRLEVELNSGVTEIRHAGDAHLTPDARAASRLPSGHPEGFIEALANIYSDFAALLTGDQTRPLNHLQGVDEGLRSMNFIEAAIRSSSSRTWVELGDMAAEQAT